MRSVSALFARAWASSLRLRVPGGVGGVGLGMPETQRAFMAMVSAWSGNFLCVFCAQSGGGGGGVERREGEREGGALL